jgi:catechol 2,3-dioxygenase-like lactoylglutathione lyase family enzyme
MVSFRVRSVHLQRHSHQHRKRRKTVTTTPIVEAAQEETAGDLLGILVVSLPVTDLARSAAWYRDLLGLDYVREFGDGERVTGCALADFAAHYMIALRLRSTTQRRADLRGEHPITSKPATPPPPNASAAAFPRSGSRTPAEPTPTGHGRNSSTPTASACASSTTPPARGGSSASA